MARLRDNIFVRGLRYGVSTLRRARGLHYGVSTLRRARGPRCDVRPFCTVCTVAWCAFMTLATVRYLRVDAFDFPLPASS